MSDVKGEASQNAQSNVKATSKDGVSSLIKKAIFKEVNVGNLQVHPIYSEIYGRKGATDIADLAADIDEHGPIVPIVVTSDNNILVGSRRFWAYEQLKLEKVKVMVVEIDEEDVCQFIIASKSDREKSIRDIVNEVLILRGTLLKKQGIRGDGEHTNKIISQTTGQSTDKIQKIIKINSLNPKLFDKIESGNYSLNSAWEAAKLVEEMNNLNRILEFDREYLVPDDIANIKSDFTDKVKDFADKSGRHDLAEKIDQSVVKPESVLKVLKNEENEQKSESEESEGKVIKLKIENCPCCHKPLKKELSEKYDPHADDIIKFFNGLNIA